MNPDYDISKLHPVIPPEPVVFEPLTIGWYILGGLVLLILVFLAFFRFRAWQKRKYRRDAIRMLKREVTKKIFSEDKRVEGILNLSEIIKSVAMQSYSGKPIAEKTGIEWTQFLTETCRKTDFNIKPGIYLSEVQYRKEDYLNSIDQSQLLGLISLSIKWIGGHRV
jgi:hypothetical protein